MSTRSSPPRPKGLLGDLPGDELTDACCWACSGGGDVLCCDGCRAVYHLACLGLSQMPGDDEDFLCPLCSCKECGKPTRSQQQLPRINTQLVPVQQKQLQVCGCVLGQGWQAQLSSSS
ncbi:hypothetical protein OEZ85_008067 [Tetradesmus obliquus]|uniref:PHD-type domain-containing protein n=1 Tax=Tetradesmus obliquus TaxID=3088 RepID=A0ABY8THS1_TETOB|nr:hypothetical protein OEZ85_008067 [Tetradesmus obliquus]